MKISASDLYYAEYYTSVTKNRIEELLSVLDKIQIEDVDLSNGYLLDSAKNTVHGIIDNTIIDLSDRLKKTKHILAHLDAGAEMTFAMLDSDYEFNYELMDKTEEMINSLDIRDDLEEAGYSLDLISSDEDVKIMLIAERQIQYLINAEGLGDKIDQYELQIDECLSKISTYQAVIYEATGRRISSSLSSSDTIISMYDVDDFNEAKENLPILKQQYEDLSETMMVLKTMRDYSLNMGYSIYTLYDDFDKMSSIDNDNLFADTKYDDYLTYLNEEEIKIAKYLSNTGNSDGLEEYLNLIHSTVNERKGKQMANDIMEKIEGYYQTASKQNSGRYESLQDFVVALGNAMQSGATGVPLDYFTYDEVDATKSTLTLLASVGFFDGINNFIDGIENLWSADGIISSEQYKTMFLIQSLKDYFAEEQFMDIIATSSYEISSSIGNMSIPMAVGYITKCSEIGSILMGLSAAGNAREQGLQSGMKDYEAWIYGTLSGLSETVVGNVVGSIPGISNLNKFAEIPGLKGYLSKMICEGAEEATQSILEPYIWALATGTPADEVEIDWIDVFKSGIYGVITTGILNGNYLFMDGVNYSIDNINKQEMEKVLNLYENEDITNVEVRNQLAEDLKNAGASIVTENQIVQDNQNSELIMNNFSIQQENLKNANTKVITGIQTQKNVKITQFINNFPFVSKMSDSAIQKILSAGYIIDENTPVDIYKRIFDRHVLSPYVSLQSVYDLCDQQTLVNDILTDSQQCYRFLNCYSVSENTSSILIDFITNFDEISAYGVQTDSFSKLFVESLEYKNQSDISSDLQKAYNYFKCKSYKVNENTPSVVVDYFLNQSNDFSEITKIVEGCDPEKLTKDMISMAVKKGYFLTESSPVKIKNDVRYVEPIISESDNIYKISSTINSCDSKILTDDMIFMAIKKGYYLTESSPAKIKNDVRYVETMLSDSNNIDVISSILGFCDSKVLTKEIISIAMKKGFYLDNFSPYSLKHSEIVVETILSESDNSGIISWAINSCDSKILTDDMIFMAIKKGYYLTESSPDKIRNDVRYVEAMLSENHFLPEIQAIISCCDPEIFTVDMIFMAKEKGYRLDETTPLDLFETTLEPYVEEYIKGLSPDYQDKIRNIIDTIGYTPFAFEGYDGVFSYEFISAFGEKNVSQIYKYCSLGGTQIDFVKLVSSGKLDGFKNLYDKLYGIGESEIDIVNFRNYVDKYLNNSDLLDEIIKTDLDNDKVRLLDTYLKSNFPIYISSYNELQGYDLLVKNYVSDVINTGSFGDKKNVISLLMFNQDLSSFTEFYKCVLNGDKAKKLALSMDNSADRDLLYGYAYLLDTFGDKILMDYSDQNEQYLKTLAERLNLLSYSSLSDIFVAYNDVNRVIKYYYGLEVNKSLTDLSSITSDGINVRNNGKYTGNKYGINGLVETDNVSVDYIEVNSNYRLLQHKMNAYGSGGKLVDYLKPRLIGRSYLCLSMIGDDKFGVPKNDYSAPVFDINNVTLLFDKINPNNLLYCASSDISSYPGNWFINDLDVMTGRPYEFLTVDELLSDTKKDYHNEYVIYRDGVSVSGILVTGLEPTQYEIDAAATLGVPLVKINYNHDGSSDTKIMSSDNSYSKGEMFDVIKGFTDNLMKGLGESN